MVVPLCLLSLLGGTVVGQHDSGPVVVDINAPPEEQRSGVCKRPGDPPAPLRVRSVSIEGRWNGRLELPIKPGDPLLADNASQSLNLLLDRMSAAAVNVPDSETQIVIRTVTGDCLNIANGEVDFVLKPAYFSLTTVRVGENALPIPRWREPSPPGPLNKLVKRVLPSASALLDDTEGTTLSGALHPTLLEKLSADGEQEHQLAANLAVAHSLDEDFYSDDAGLAYDWTKEDGSLRAISVLAGYGTLREPLGEDVHERDGASVGAELLYKLSATGRLRLNAGIEKADDAVRPAIGSPVATSETTTSIRALYEFIPTKLHGFARASVWGREADGYRQVAFRGGYAKEFSLRPNQTLGVEIAAGAGKSWGDVPQHALFQGGGSQRRFLYEGASTPEMVAMPPGPLMRSFARNTARLADTGVTGGTRYWHLNVDLSFPVRGWFMPLIPNESSDITLDDSDQPLSIKQIMLNQVNSGPNLLQPVLVNRGMSPEEASRRSQEMFAEVKPAAEYIIRDANLIAVKPMLMLDAAGLSDGDISENWTAVGLGVQVTLVTARLEAGYSRTVSGSTFGGSRGAPFARLVFQRLF